MGNQNGHHRRGAILDAAHRIQRATSDLVETTHGALPEIPWQKTDTTVSTGVVEKYGPKSAERKWRKGGARLHAHLSFEFLRE